MPKLQPRSQRRRIDGDGMMPSWSRDEPSSVVGDNLGDSSSSSSSMLFYAQPLHFSPEMSSATSISSSGPADATNALASSPNMTSEARKVSFEDGLRQSSSASLSGCSFDVTSKFLTMSPSVADASLSASQPSPLSVAGLPPNMPSDDSLQKRTSGSKRGRRKRSLHRLPPSKCLSSLAGGSGSAGGESCSDDALEELGNSAVLIGSSRPYKRRSSSEDWGRSSSSGRSSSPSNQSQQAEKWGQFVDVVPPYEEEAEATVAAPSSPLQTIHSGRNSPASLPSSSSLPSSPTFAPCMPPPCVPYPKNNGSKNGGGGGVRRFALPPRRLKNRRGSVGVAPSAGADASPLFAGPESSPRPVSLEALHVAPAPSSAPATLETPIELTRSSGLYHHRRRHHDHEQPPLQTPRTPRPSMNDAQLASALHEMSVSRV